MFVLNTTIYALAWVFAVQQPNGTVDDRIEFTKATFEKMSACNVAAIERERGAAAIATAIQKAGGKLAYSRVICVPVRLPLGRSV